MCGITGFLDAKRDKPRAALERMAGCMATSLYHRGPDDGGVWADETTGIALGFRRLAIIDLTAEGHQPMLSADGRFALVFNGEIYNYLEIRDELLSLGHTFRGRSDTEVMLAAFVQWGVATAVKRFVGMFGFGLWDRQERTLTLARDRMGEKPLYYGWSGRNFLFGSELKALRAHPSWCGLIDRNALALFMRYNYVPAPHTIYDGFYKLIPGTLLTLSEADMRTCDLPTPVPYWSLQETATAGVRNPFVGSNDEAVERLDSMLRQSVRGQMISDVPLGAFLSGGVDSSTIVALMQAQSNRPVKTFTIGFHEQSYNEAAYAKKVACHLGTDHTELYVTPQEAFDVIPRLPALYDEPFGDSSQIPTFLLSQLTRQHVTVSLSGDGGDELFCGYNRYYLGKKIWDKISWMPTMGRYGAAKVLRAIPSSVLDMGVGILAPKLRQYGKAGDVGHKVNQMAYVIGVNNEQTLYMRLMSQWKEPQELVLGSCEPMTVFTDAEQWASLPEFQQRMMLLDGIAYLPDDILVKVDRASMGVSLEARVPLLDHRIVEFAWSLPHSMKLQNGKGKWVLRQVLDRYVPKEMIDRPKMGFGVPIGDWMRGPLKDWAESLLDESRIRQEGYLNPAPVRKKWAEHLSGKQNWQYYLWNVLMFQAWLSEEKQ